MKRRKVNGAENEIGNEKSACGKLSLATLAEKLGGWSIGLQNEGFIAASPRTLFLKKRVGGSQG